MNSSQRPVMPVSYFLGLDLGKLQDWTAIAILEAQDVATEWDAANWCWKFEKQRRLKFMDRPALGTSYTDIVQRVRQILLRDTFRGQEIDVVVDFTGVGVPVTDMLKAMLTEIRSEARLVSVWITGGNTTKQEGNRWNVPKRDLVDNLAVMLQNGQLQIDKRMPLADVLSKEVMVFQHKVSRETGNDSYGARTEKDHDDLVLAVALACWRARTRHIGGPMTSQLPAGVL